MKHRLSLYFGRRGGILTLFGVVWVILGFGFATIPSERFSRPGPGGPLQFMDSMPIPGIFWIICGIVALVNGLIRRRIGNEDAWGYAALVMPPLMWSLTYLVSFTQWLLTQNEANPYGRETSYLGFLVFAVIVVIIRIVANWTDDLDVERDVQERLHKE